MRFLHTSDWQIGMKAAHIGAAAGKVVRVARIEAIRRVQSLAREKRVDFVLIAGDTFEHDGIGKPTIDSILDLLGGFDSDVYVIPGNHDPWMPGGIWEYARGRCRRSVHILNECVPLPISGGTLFPCPLTARWSANDPTKWMQQSPDGEGIRIGLAHGNMAGLPSNGDLDYPIPADAATRANLDYLALGHWHSFLPFKTSGSVRMAYSGTPETTAFGERDSGFVSVVEIEEHGAPPRVDQHRIGALKWCNIEREICHEGELGALLQELRSEKEVSKLLVRIRLKGLLYAADAGLLSTLREYAEQTFLFGRVDDKDLISAPGDDQWIDNLPDGIIRRAALHLREQRDAIATHALMELYQLVNGGDR
jgi:DNA repair exonuclease SbcCD nuclease subunit